MVVDRNPLEWREKLKAIHADWFGPGKTDPLAPVQLEVLDRATDEAIQRLIAMGLLNQTTRASRSLLPAAAPAEAAPLSAAELARAKAHHATAARKLNMARILGNGGFADEARAALLDAIHGMGKVLAVEQRLPEPPELKDALQPPVSHGWGEALPSLRGFVQDPALPWPPIAGELANLMREKAML